MKTQGVRIVSGYLVVSHPNPIPVQFWNRVKHALTKAMLLDEFAAEYALERHQVIQSRERLNWTPSWDWDREEQLFRRWVERLFGAQSLWPWQRGWTEQAVDEYLQAPVRREAA